MKFLKIITPIVILGGLFSSLLIVSEKSGVGFFILMPYLLMLALLPAYINKQTHPAPLIGYLISVTIVCTALGSALYGAAFNPGSSSTSGLVFVIAPISSIFLLAILYVVCTWLIGLIGYNYNDKRLMNITLVASALFFVRFLLPFFLVHSSPPEIKERDKFSFTKGDISKSKKLGVFVKELHYRVDSFTGPVTFTPYIEKAFKYLDDDSTRIEVIRDKFGSYSVSFQKEAIGDGVLETVNYHECEYMPCLRKPELNDTIIFNIKRFGYVVGTIKVWD
jgi:hypothetical protein